jgi:exodeoxyribonuclease VII large subunit
MNDLLRERPVLRPAQLNALARDLLEGSFASVWVQGEISNFSRPGSGHIYFTLKDDRAQVRCALFRQKAAYLRFVPRDGALVLVRGRLTLYEARGDYQLVLEHMEEAGEGALRAAFETLKARLAAEGLFDAGRKRALPRLPRRLGVLTSPSGAAVRDVLHVLERRFPLLEVEVLPVPVQGANAAAGIRAMLQSAGASGRYDVLLLTRGGGSLEDLWSFNDEALARAVAASPVPVVSAVGHEIDFSLTDFAADLRAPTPSAAAELLVPDAAELFAALAQSRRRLVVAAERLTTYLAQRTDRAFLRLRALSPGARLERGGHRLSVVRARLDRAHGAAMERRLRRVREARLALDAADPRRRLAEQSRRAEAALRQLHACGERGLQRRQARLQALARAMHSLSPLGTLARGYAILRDESRGTLIRSVDDATPGQRLRARVADGEFPVQVAGPDGAG